MRRVNFLIDASPCEREARVLSTGARLTVKWVILYIATGIIITVLVFVMGSFLAAAPEGRINQSRGAFRCLQFRRYNRCLENQYLGVGRRNRETA
jgi:hypothetical protein